MRTTGSTTSGRRTTSASRPIQWLDFIAAQQPWSDAARVRIAAKLTGGETRYAVLGTIHGRHHTIIVTYRGPAIRIISARLSSPAEIQIYEQHKTKKP